MMRRRHLLGGAALLAATQARAQTPADPPLTLR